MTNLALSIYQATNRRGRPLAKGLAFVSVVNGMTAQALH